MESFRIDAQDYYRIIGIDRYMATCAECGDGMDTTYDCRDCGEAFCVDCRLPGDHECTPSTESVSGSTDGGSTPAASQSISMPKPPRITALLPVWRLLPWQVHALLAIVLVPVSPLVLAQHVYHERVAAAIAAETDGSTAETADDDATGQTDEPADSWTPSWVYYFPVLLFGVAALVGNAQFIVAFGGVSGLIASLVYVVQKRRHGASLLELSR